MNSVNLRTRGLLLVAFPSAWLVVFVVVLYSMLSQIHNELLLQSRSREIASLVHIVMRDAVDVVSFGYLGHGKNEMMDASVVLTKVSNLRPHIDRLLVLAKSKEQKANIARLQASRKSLLKTLEWTVEEQKLGIKHWKKQKGRTDEEMTAELKHFSKALSDLSATEEKMVAQRSATVFSDLNSKLEALIFIAVATSVGVAMALGVLYIMGIKRPLGRITENSRRLSENKELLPMLAGANEIAELDRLLHKVNSSINEALRREQAMFDNAADLICALNAEGVFTRANLFAIEVLCYEPEHLIGMNIFDIVIEDDLLVAETHLRGFKEKDEIKEFELRMRRQDGIVVDTRWATIWSESEGNVFCVVHDTTQEKNIERLKQDFLDMVSHDLRSPLTAMLASMSMIAAGARGELPETAKEEVAGSVQDIERLIGFINELLEFQKLQSGRTPFNLKPTNLDALVRDAVKKMGEAASSKGIEIQVPVGNWTVMCDPEKITQILVQLLLNAIAVTNAGDPIDIAITLPEGGSTVEIEVTDSGPVLSSVEREMVFEHLFDGGAGSGDAGSGHPSRLGLAVCKLIIEAHGGEVGVREPKPLVSEPKSLDPELNSQDPEPKLLVPDAGGAKSAGKGNTFWFYLPSARG